MPAGGGLLQLVATGKQDVFLTGNPQISFFKTVYRRHTNFAIESMPMYFDGTPNFGQRITCLVPRRGDLLGRMYLQVTLPPLTLQTASNELVSYVNSIGNALIERITVEIGEQEIDRQTGEWMEVWGQLTTPPGQRDALNAMLGRVDNYLPPDLIPRVVNSVTNGLQIYIPLMFWFNKNPGMYLPLLALQYHPVRINITLAPLQSLFWTDQLVTNPNLQVNPVPITEMMLWGDYVFLDTEERRQFVTQSHEYLIEQVQYTPPISVTQNTTTSNIQVDFNHPIKEFVILPQRNYMQTVHEPFNYSSLATAEEISGGASSLYMAGLQFGQVRTDLIRQMVLQLDGYDRFQAREAPYFRLIQPYEHHTVTPVSSFIYTYSFALSPELIQPSGSMNASRIDSIVWQIIMNTDLIIPQSSQSNPQGSIGNCHITVYALNYNVLRITNGFGGLLFTV